MTREINVARDFSRFPAGRYLSDGPYSAQRLREEVLVPALRDSSIVVVELDGTMGYGSSFLEETFGGLVREHGIAESDIRRKLEVRSDADPGLVTEAWSYVKDASADEVG